MKKIWIITLLFSMLLCGCGNKDEIMKIYDASSSQSEFSCFNGTDLALATPFAADLCVVAGEYTERAALDAEAAFLCNMEMNHVMYAKNATQKMNPASITKSMTVLLALEYGNMEDIVTITEEAMVTESGAVLMDLKPGDQITLDSLVKAAMLKSANDAASAIAIHIGGSLDGFADMMNERARQLGATNTNFVNPHGLTDEEHYTTAYDLYLIMNEAAKNPDFIELIQLDESLLTYTDEAGNPKSITVTNSNRYINGKQTPPDGVTVIGGKTGTTNAAGSCLVLLSKDSSEQWHCSVILKAASGDELFEQMNTLLGLEN